MKTKTTRAKKMVKEIGSKYSLRPNTHLESNVIRYMVLFSGEEQTRMESVLKAARTRLQFWMNKYGVYRDPDRNIINDIDQLLKP